MNKRSAFRYGATAAIFLASFVASHASETLTSDPTGYAGPSLNLSAYATGAYNFTFGPASIPGGITFTASPGGSGGFPFGGNSGQGSVIGQGSYGLASNGSFGGNAVYIGVDSGTGYDTLTFSTPVSQFGAYWNYAPGVGNDPTLTTFDGLGNQIASFDLATLAPISTPGGFNQFDFRGIVASSPEIKSIEFGGAYILLAGTPTGVTPGVPEPSTWALLLAGFAGLGFAGYRRNKGAAVTA